MCKAAYKAGDKFVVEIDGVLELKDIESGKSVMCYTVKGIDDTMFVDSELDCLERYDPNKAQKDIPFSVGCYIENVLSGRLGVVLCASDQLGTWAMLDDIATPIKIRNELYRVTDKTPRFVRTVEQFKESRRRQ